MQDVIVGVFVVINHFKKKIYISWISGESEAVHSESDSVGRGHVGRGAPSPHAIAAAHGVAYVATGTGELVAYAMTGCGQNVCSPLWTSAPSGMSLFTPTIANGVVYVSALDLIYTQGDVLAYPTTCTDGCQPLTTLVLGGANETPVAVAGGRVYATTVNGNIDSFGLTK